MTWHRPSGPTPITATDSPPASGAPFAAATTRAVASPWVTDISSVRTATSDGRPSGTRKSGVRGSSTIASDQPPNRWGGRSLPRLLP